MVALLTSVPTDQRDREQLLASLYQRKVKTEARDTVKLEPGLSGLPSVKHEDVDRKPFIKREDEGRKPYIKDENEDRKPLFFEQRSDHKLAVKDEHRDGQEDDWRYEP